MYLSLDVPMYLRRRREGHACIMNGEKPQTLETKTQPGPYDSVGGISCMHVSYVASYVYIYKKHTYGSIYIYIYNTCNCLSSLRYHTFTHPIIYICTQLSYLFHAEESKVDVGVDIKDLKLAQHEELLAEYNSRIYKLPDKSERAFSDYLCLLPRTVEHFFMRLIDVFGMKVGGIAVVE